MYYFKDEYRIGVEHLDKEHERLFEIADKAYTVLMDDYIHDKYDYIVEILNELKEYSMIHFQHEEEYMASIHYRKLLSQKVEHQDFMDKVNEYDLTQIDENQKEAIFGILEFLNEWLIDHIVKSDKLIGEQVD